MIKNLVLVLIVVFAFAKSTNAQTENDSIANIFRNTEVKVLLPSDYVLSGTKVEAEIRLVQNDSNMKATAFVEGWQKLKMENGKAIYRTFTVGSGVKTIEGYVDYYIGDRYKRYGFRKDYTVYKGAANISADRMNMLFIGIENPLSISVPGFPPEKIIVYMTNGALTKVGNTSYIARVSKKRDVKIQVSVKMDDGSTKSVGSAQFRVGNAPTLFPQLSTFSSGTELEISEIKNSINDRPIVTVSVGESFPFDNLKFTVSEFRFSIVKTKGENPEPITVTGKVLTPNVLKLVNNIEKGDRIIIDNIKLAAPDEAWSTMPFIISIK